MTNTLGQVQRVLDQVIRAVEYLFGFTLAAGLIATQTTSFGSATLIPSLVMLALVGPISMLRVTGHLSAWPGSTRMSGQGVVLTALTLQFIMFFACAQTALGPVR